MPAFPLTAEQWVILTHNLTWHAQFAPTPETGKRAVESQDSVPGAPWALQLSAARLGFGSGFSLVPKARAASTRLRYASHKPLDRR